MTVITFESTFLYGDLAEYYDQVSEAVNGVYEWYQ